MILLTGFASIDSAVEAMRKGAADYVSKPFAPEEPVLRVVDKVAPTDSRVLVIGESGTGKELIARIIHERSKRAGGAFLAVNCGAFAEGVLESELFGHERGAFTGAVATSSCAWAAPGGC